MATPLECALRIHAALLKRGIEHAVGGAIAYQFLVEPRATKDVDLNLFVTEESLEPAFDALEEAGCEVDRTESKRRAAERGDFRAVLDGYRIDLFPMFHPFHAEVRRRVWTAPIEGTLLPLLSAEDLILFKVLFDRPKDWVDISNLVHARGSSLDRSYLKRWLGELLAEDDDRCARLNAILA